MQPCKKMWKKGKCGARGDGGEQQKIKREKSFQGRHRSGGKKVQNTTRKLGGGPGGRGKDKS